MKKQTQYLLLAVAIVVLIVVLLKNVFNVF